MDDKEKAVSGIGFGNFLAFIISLVHGDDFFWCIIHALFGWFYVVYYFFTS